MQKLKMHRQLYLILSHRGKGAVMKRSAAYPERRSYGEFKLNTQRKYGLMVSKPSKINPIFLQDNYGIKKEIKND